MSDLPSPEELLRQSKALAAGAKALKGLAGAVQSGEPKRIAKATQDLRNAGHVPTEAIAAGAATWLEEERAGRRSRLSASLRAACVESGIELAVLSNQPLRLRLAPIGVEIDVDRDSAELSFGQQVVAKARAEAGSILAARRSAIAELEGKSWDPAAHHRILRRACARLQGEKPGATWVELADVLPEVAHLRQGRAFRADPLGKRFESYSKARFLYDLHRLRRDGMLACEGWRLGLGDATGNSTSQKDRVFFVENERGDGQYRLTMRFVREESG